jgi:hypothetical protein
LNVPKPVSPSTLEALRALQTAPPVIARPRPTRPVSIALAVVALLAVSVIGFAVVRDGALATRERQAAVEVDALVAGAARVGAALRTFGSTRESGSAWLSRTSAMVADLAERARTADATLVGIAMMPRARLAEALQSTTEAVEQARANAAADKELMAHDVIESNGKPAADALDAALAAVRTATAEEIAAMRSRWRLAASVALGAWVVIWGIGLAWFAREQDGPRTAAIGRDRPRTAAVPGEPAPATIPVAPPSPEPAVVETPAPAMAPVATSVALRGAGAVADACEAVAGLTDAAQMASALEGMAQALGASGLVLWMRDGDALSAAAAHGYAPGVPQRLGRVAADDGNLIARAWQARTSQTAPEAPGQRAAVAAPIGAAGVITGVLAAEFPTGREADADIVATSRILAAQLSAVLGAGASNGNSPHLEATGS